MEHVRSCDGAQDQGTRLACNVPRPFPYARGGVWERDYIHLLFTAGRKTLLVKASNVFCILLTYKTNHDILYKRNHHSTATHDARSKIAYVKISHIAFDET